MSPIAVSFLVPKPALEGLRQVAVPKTSWFAPPKDTYWDYLKQNGRPVADYPWSGYVLGTVLDWLEEKHQIDLMTSSEDELSNFLNTARGATHYVLPVEHRTAYLDRLDPSAFSAEEFRRYYNEFHGTDERDLGTSMEDGIGVLRQALTSVDGDSLVLLIIV
jgi:hypothetical protein